MSQFVNACRRNDHETIQHLLLLDQLVVADLDLEACDKRGNTALLWAIIRKNYNLIETLIDKGANVNHQNKKGDTALLMTIKYCARSNLIGLLLDKGADPNIRNHAGDYPLLEAAKRQFFEYIQIRLCGMTTVLTPNIIGNEPIHYNQSSYIVRKTDLRKYVNSRQMQQVFITSVKKLQFPHLYLKAGFDPDLIPFNPITNLLSFNLNVPTFVNYCALFIFSGFKPDYTHTRLKRFEKHFDTLTWSDKNHKHLHIKIRKRIITILMIFHKKLPLELIFLICSKIV